MYRACLMGASFQYGNLGVSALAASVVKLILEICPKAQISFFIGNRMPEHRKLQLADRTVDIEMINYRMSPKSRFHEHILCILLMAIVHRFVPVRSLRTKIINATPSLRVIMDSNFVGDIRGGDSFSDIYGLRNFLLGSLPSIITLLLKKELILLPQTYGPYSSSFSKWVARLILCRCSIILARDWEGISLVRKLLGRRGTTKKIEFCPDVAFMLDSLKCISIDIQPPLIQEPKVPIIGFNVSGLLYNGGFTRANMFGLKLDYRIFARKLAEKLLRESTAHILLVPHSFAPKGDIESDFEACSEIMKELLPSFEGRVHLTGREYDQSGMKRIIGLSEFFIGSRMHACISALSQGIPTVGVAYSRKFSGVFKSVGCGDAIIDAREVNLDEAVQMIWDLFQNRDRFAPFLAEKVNEAKGRLLAVFQELVNRPDGISSGSGRAQKTISAG